MQRVVIDVVICPKAFEDCFVALSLEQKESAAKKDEKDGWTNDDPNRYAK